MSIDKLAARIDRAARGAESQEWDSYGRFKAVRGAVIRAIRRELGLPRHGLAPESVWNAAGNYARCVAEFPGWESTWETAERVIRPALRRMVKRAQRGTL